MRWMMIVLMLAGITWGQATTQPNKALLNENSKLRAEIARLKREIQDLPAEISRLSERPRDDSAKQTEAVEHKPTDRSLKIGMTLEQANHAMGKDGSLTHEQADGVKVYEWEFVEFAPQERIENGRYLGTDQVEVGRRYVIGTFRNGLLEAQSIYEP